MRLVLIAAIISLFVTYANFTAQSQQMVITPSDDSWIAGLGSTELKGNNARLGICPVAQYWIYLKFDLSEISGVIADAELRLTRIDGSRPEEISLYFIPDDNWSEATINGPNRPAPQTVNSSDAITIGIEKPAYDTWHSPNLAAAVQTEANGDGVITLMLREDPGNTLDVRHFFSKEGASNQDQTPRLVVTLAPDAGDEEMLADDWSMSDIANGVKPSFDFGPDGAIHIMGMTEETNGVVWHAHADSINGPWNPVTVAEGYFYGPGDIRVAPNGDAHIAWHDHDLQNPSHVIVAPDGGLQTPPIDTPSSHDGWDNSLAIDAEGGVHQASVFPSQFGAVECLQYGFFDGDNWTYERNIPNSGRFMYGLNTSIAVDSMGRPHIAYCESTGWTTDGDLKYAVKIDEGWQISTVVTGGARGRFPTLALDHWDRPHIAWLDLDDADKTKATVRYGVLNSDQWEIEDVDRLEYVMLGFGDARKSTSLALDKDSRPHIAYSDKQAVRYATKPFSEWQRTTVLESPEDRYQSLVVMRLDADQAPAIVFWEPAQDSAGLVRMARMNAPASGVIEWSIYK
ncbi:MAG: DNRLRE domain-containing protein [Candidatus Hinthialibacter antarcticus]|nr:DNRLRE domain-containing protein [Candidatus Hinthialibacter antarcticus]